MTAPAALVRFRRILDDRGWATSIQETTGTTPDTSHHDRAGNWDRVKMVTAWEDVVGEDGAPLLTPSGKPKRRRVVTDEPLIITVHRLMAIRGHNAILVVWADRKFERGWLNGRSTATSTEFEKWAKTS